MEKVFTLSNLSEASESRLAFLWRQTYIEMMCVLNIMRVAGLILLALTLLISLDRPVMASGDSQIVEVVDDASEAAEAENVSVWDRLVFAPIPLVNPTLGAGLTGMLMYMHPDDDFGNDPELESNKNLHSITGAAIMGSTNESWMTGMFHKGYYANDRIRSLAYLAYGEFNLKYYGVDGSSFFGKNPLEYTANITAFQTTLMAKVAGKFFIGPQYQIYEWGLGTDLSKFHPILPKIAHTVTTAGFGLAGEWDGTNHSLYATDGGRFKFEAMDYGTPWGGDYEYAKGKLEYAHFFGLTEDLVLASMSELNISSGSTPFFDMPNLRMRGFPYAKYINKQAMSVQLEMKYSFARRWGVSVFGGLGWVAEYIDELPQAQTVPTGGFGLRYMLSEKEKMYMTTEVAFGPNTEALYFRVGEWF